MAWIRDIHDVGVRNKDGKIVYKRIYCHSVSGELRVKKMGVGKDGKRKALYVKVPGLATTKVNLSVLTAF
jgi:hypothetical protein